MKKYSAKASLLRKCGFFCSILLLSLGVMHGAISAPAQSPLFLTQTSTPMVSLVLSLDQELFKKAYNDYSNLDGGTLTIADTTYRNNFEYYGYFDPLWCYSYSPNTTTPGNSYFTPITLAVNHKCTAGSGQWSGNFLNWATMTRVDILRRVLYGGKRSVDTTAQTVLERSYLPKDIHAFVKVYSGTDMNQLTPYTYNATSQPAISMCNVSTGQTGHPVMRVVPGAWKQWSASESQQCQYGTGTMPASAVQLIEATVKVDTCVTGKDAATSVRCKQYGTSTHEKPFGILQNYGESGNIKFNLVTGSYLANTKGGVLRREASLIAGNTSSTNDEVNLSTGQFNNSVNGIIKNIDAFKIATYSFANGNFTDCNTHSITVDTVKGQATNSQRCSDWGNPMSEIYLEALRYITGNKSASNGFNVNDTAAVGSTFPGVPGLTRSLWGTGMADPWLATEWCAKCFSIVLSTGANSFDGDDLSSVSNLPGLSAGISALNAITDSIGTQEYSDFTARKFFAGGTTNSERYCKPTTLTGLSGFRGVCPEQPATEGSYHMAGLAYYARVNDLRSNTTHKGVQNLNTYAIDLAESLPSFKVPVNGVDVEFLPACEARPGTGNWQTCSLVDVTVESLTYSGGNLVAGSYLFYWEDSLWGNDYDFDGAQRIRFCVGSACDNPATASINEGIPNNKIKIVNSIPYAVAGNHLHFSYNIVGASGFVDIDEISNQSSATPTVTPNDLASFQGGVLIPWANRPGGQNFNTLKSTPDNIPSTVTRVESIFTASTSNTAVLLKKPLYYVAKYGGFNDSDGNNQPNLTSEWDTNGDSIPDNYFSVKNPADLEKSLSMVFDSIVDQVAAASSAAVSSTRLSEGSYIYQARFNSANWSGELAAFSFNSSGDLASAAALTTNTTMPKSMTGRTVYTSSGLVADFGKSVKIFDWSNLTLNQQTLLASSTTTPLTAAQQTLAQNRLNWLKGDASNEVTLLRSRTTEKGFRNVLGDIVDSSPTYDGPRDFRYDALPGVMGSSYSSYLSTKKGLSPRIFVGANDGMIHAFDAKTLTYIYSYVPSAVYAKLDEITRADYGSSGNPHQYLMNGQITVGDAYINGQWRNILVAALGAGGKNVFALDITAGATPKLLFDLVYDPALGDDLTKSSSAKIGHVMGKPFIVPMKNGRFAAVFGNGYDSLTNKSSLFVVDLENPTGSYTKVIETNAGNGLSSTELLPNTFGQIEYAYAGDLQGNLWKFDLSATSNSSWTYTKLFVAKDAANNIQPIFAPPTLGRNGQKENKINVYFGTGKYFETGDVSTGSAAHSMYAIVDKGALLARTDLHAKSFSETGNTRTMSDETVDWASKEGWYVDFNTPGERITVKPLLIYDTLIFPTLIPSSLSCTFGGTSWLMRITAVGDKPGMPSSIEEVGDGEKGEYLILGDLSFGVLDPTNDPSGGGGPPGCPEGTTPAQVIVSASDGTIKTKDACLPETALGRMNWRQLD